MWGSPLSMGTIPILVCREYIHCSVSGLPYLESRCEPHRKATPASHSPHTRPHPNIQWMPLGGPCSRSQGQPLPVPPGPMLEQGSRRRQSWPLAQAGSQAPSLSGPGRDALPERQCCGAWGALSRRWLAVLLWGMS